MVNIAIKKTERAAPTSVQSENTYHGFFLLKKIYALKRSIFIAMSCQQRYDNPEQPTQQLTNEKKTVQNSYNFILIYEVIIKSLKPN